MCQFSKLIIDIFFHRVINLSSGAGKITYIGKVKQAEVLAPDLTVERLSAIMDRFVK